MKIRVNLPGLGGEKKKKKKRKKKSDKSIRYLKGRTRPFNVSLAV
jgi:hypothetical protein